jgi:hypothetical protein
LDESSHDCATPIASTGNGRGGTEANVGVDNGDGIGGDGGSNSYRITSCNVNIDVASCSSMIVIPGVEEAAPM